MESLHFDECFCGMQTFNYTDTKTLVMQIIMQFALSIRWKRMKITMYTVCYKMA